MEDFLNTTVSKSPGFDQALALGRIHSILSALIEHCRTRPAYLYTGCFTCELQIRSQGNAFVSPIASDPEAEAELLRVWELVQAADVPGAETLVSAGPHPFSSTGRDSELNPPSSTPTVLGPIRGKHQHTQEPCVDDPASQFFLFNTSG